MKNITFALLIGAAATGVGCGSRHSYSAPVAVNIKAASGDVSAGTLTEDKTISAETGNPYGQFLADARAQLGRDPTDVGVSGLTLFLGAQSVGVTALEQVFTGQVDVLFFMPASGSSYSVGHVTNPVGTGPVTLNVDFDSTKLTGQDHLALLSSGFKVVVRGTAAAGFATRSADAALQNTFTFKALE